MSPNEQEAPKWHDEFDKRQLRLIKNCQSYVLNDPAGLPGHQLMLIVTKLVSKLIGVEEPERSVDRCVCDKCGQPHDPKLVSDGIGKAA